MSSLIFMFDQCLDSLGWVKYIIYALVIAFMAIVARKKRWLTVSGSIASIVSGSIVLYIGGFSAFMILTFFFLAGSLVGKLLDREIKSEKKGNERDMAQVFANCIPALLALFIYRLTPYKVPAIVAYAAAIAEALADTWAGDFGMLSNRDPVSIITFTRVPKGISGGVTALGFAGAMFGSAMIALLFEGTYSPSFASFFVIAISGFFGSVIDSVLGATIQVHYRDREGFLTEKEGDGKGRFERVRGIPFIDNDAVNLISGLFSFSLAFFISSIVL